MSDIEHDRPVDRPRSRPRLRVDGTSNRNPDLLRPSKHWNQKSPTADPYVPNGTSVNRLKSKIRDLTRLLRRPEKLPADVQVVQERALAGYRQDLERIESAKRRKQMISKYHMVRFFGRFL